jgi:two-component system sensor histidine kinase ChvG
VRLRVTLRAKLVLVALVLSVIPLVGYVHVKQIERLLREGQEQALRSNARAIAMALHDRPQLVELRPGEPASDEMQLILKSLARAESRVWIVDRNQRLLALVGDLKQRPREEEVDLATRLVHPVAALFLERPTEDFDDSLPESEIANAASALQGVPARRLRESVDARATIVSASHPVWAGEQVVAAVVAEETTNTTRSVYNRALEQVVAVTLIAFAAGALTLLLFASRLSTRLLRLRDEAEAAIDSQGRVRRLIAGSAAGDEIGDLSRSFSTMLERLAQYNNYLENMAGRLSHELRTPIAVVRSSLENLRLQPMPEEAGVVLARANDGLRRLDTLLTRMSEATRLEQLVREQSRERFDARDVVSGSALAHPQKRFEVEVPASPVWLRGSPDLYAQMLDKLVGNAVDFATGEEPIRIRLEARGGEAMLTVSNRGPRLPEAMAGKLFESMVSVRGPRGGNAAPAEPHLGLGLYIVRLIAEFHGGRAEALDREDGSGVVIRVRCPLSAEYSR